ncbi:MAG: MipA/OmpV family protein [Cytophagales bacterium]|nr:MipA/OmpV family protein [Rhizobacter sp.]
MNSLIHPGMAALLLVVTSVTAWAQEPAPATAPTSAPAPTSVVDTGPIPVVQRPLWELGLGLSVLNVPDYRGADQSHRYLLPFPYIVYRGTWFRSDRNGTRAMLFDSQRVKLDLSLGAAVPTRSETAAREGMPDLPGNAEVGPSINILLVEPANQHYKLELRLPLRAAISLERSPRYVGATFSPNLNLDISAAGGWNIGVLTGPLFANRKYHAEYYEVSDLYATAQRPAYTARGGYAGWQSLASTSRRFGNTWAAGFVRYEGLHGAVYDDSPLVRRKSALTVGFAVSWVFATSSTSVNATD